MYINNIMNNHEDNQSHRTEQKDEPLAPVINIRKPTQNEKEKGDIDFRDIFWRQSGPAA